ncbi:MAG: hypothetical protein WCZ65_09155 [Lysobacteraceae bacterium]
MRILAAALLLLGAELARAQCAVTLDAGDSIRPSSPLPGQSLTTSLCVAVPADAERLTIRVSADNPSQDIDLLLRVGTPFANAASENPNGLSVDDYATRAHYRSTGVLGNESVVISRASRFPLRGGLVHLVLINYAATPAAFTVSAELSAADDYAPIQVVFDDPGSGDDSCDISGWNDPAPRDPVRGNNGVTLGEQRRNAMLEAARRVAEELRPAAPLRVRACWKTLEYSNGSGVLAQAGPRYVIVDDPGNGLFYGGLQARHLIHYGSMATHQLGIPFCQLGGQNCNAPPADISATFNLEVDKAANANQRYEYGITVGQTGPNNPAPVGIGFVAVAMHELGHGMGFIGQASLGGEDAPPVGTLYSYFGKTYDDAYGRHVRIIEPGLPAVVKPFLRVDTATRAAALTSGDRLRFAGPLAAESSRNILRNNIEPYDLVQLHAPTNISTGSSYSHLGTQHSLQMMLPTATSNTLRSLGLAVDVLQDVGFDPQPKEVRAFALPPDTQYFDVARDGHGIDFRRVAGTPDLYFLGFYSYDNAGNPEWYTALGRIVDGVFVPQINEFGDSLVRFNYQPGPPPVSQADGSSGFNGRVLIDFVEAANAPECRQRAADRNLEGTVALMSWTIGNQRRQWCMQPLVDPQADLELDLSSVWYNPDDPGWGITVLSFPGDGGDGIAIGVYYPDASGKGRWGIVQAGRYQPGQTYTVRQTSNGYCRTEDCSTPGALSFTDIGTLSVTLRPPQEGPSTLTLDITYPGAEGGRFQRTNVPLIPANEPRYRGN